MALTAERLREVLRYEPETGVFIRVDDGRIAGGKTGTGYRLISVFGKQYYAHRLAWLYIVGEFPSLCIDHINGDRMDNRFSNLRIAEHRQNCANARRSSANTSGLKGVSWSKAAGKWQANVKRDGVNIYLGLFKTREAAHAAYMDAAKQHFGEFARGE